MEKLINASNTSNTKFTIIYTGVTCGLIGQYITLPLFLSTLAGSAGPYFVLCWLGFLFNLVFWSLTLVRVKQGAITKEMKAYTWKRHYLFMLLGFFNALNGILIVYASPLSRTPGSLQAIISCAGTPMTVLFSKFILGKKYRSQQIMGVLLNLMGIIVSIIPIMTNFGASGVNFIWPLLFLIGQVPIVFQNIFEEKIFQECPEYDSVFLNAWLSLYQITSFLLLFWVDIIPGFGVSHSISEWAATFINGLTCFAAPWSTGIDKCSYCFLFGLLFSGAYCFSGVLSAELMKYASANTSAVVSSVSPTLVVFFWIIFAGVNAWAGGPTYTRLDIVCDIVALPIIIMGIVTFRISEQKQIKDIVDAHLGNGTKEGLLGDSTKVSVL
jgi:drug/metabolite transporter (DMT)-like permease